VGVWLTGAATASADTAAATPVVGLLDAGPQTLDAVPQTVHAVPQAVHAAAEPWAVPPAVAPIVEAVRPVSSAVTSAVVDVAAPVVTQVVTPVVHHVATPVVQHVVRPVVELAPATLGSLTDDLSDGSFPAVLPVTASDASVGAEAHAAAVPGALQVPPWSPTPNATATPAPRGSDEPTGQLPAAPNGNHSGPWAVPAPASGAGNSPAGSDSGFAVLTDHTLPAALAAAGTAPEFARDSVATTPFDPSFSPD
jgi:hypothetical protein